MKLFNIYIALRIAHRHLSPTSNAELCGFITLTSHECPINSPREGPVTRMRLHVMTSPWCDSFHVRSMIYVVAVMLYAISYVLDPG